MGTRSAEELEYALIALVNPGGIRAPLELGSKNYKRKSSTKTYKPFLGITYNDIVTVMPFQNTVDIGELQGKYLVQALERSAGPFVGQAKTRTNLLQVSGETD